MPENVEIGDPRLPRRFWDKVEVTADGCWLWTAYRQPAPRGYAQFAWNGRMRVAHRVAFVELVGPVPEGLQLDHLCRVRHCVNPAHLEAVTPQENSLRGDTIAARHAAKTHCPQGHPYAGDNLRIDCYGKRVCRTCANARNRVYARRAYYLDLNHYDAFRDRQAEEPTE